MDGMSSADSARIRGRQLCRLWSRSGFGDRNRGMSYPDLIQQDGRYWVTETQKSVARIHPIDRELLEGLWSQGNVKRVVEDGLVRMSVAADVTDRASLAAALEAALALARQGRVQFEWLGEHGDGGEVDGQPAGAHHDDGDHPGKNRSVQEEFR